MVPAFSTRIEERSRRLRGFAGSQLPHPAHAHVDKALAWIERVKPKRAVLTHLSELLDYDTLRARLPDGVEPAYDGMVVEVDGR